MRETELKFAVHPAFVVPDAFPDVANLEPLPTLNLRATYYDTDDLRLARWGITLRYRKGEPAREGWDLKLPLADSDATTREELHFDRPPGKVPDEVRSLITAFIRSASLKPVATLVTKRRTWSLTNAEGSTFALLSDDEVSVMEGRRLVARFREIEVEAADGGLDTITPVGRALADCGALPAEPIPKVVRALGPQATSPPDVVVVKALDPKAPARDAIIAALSAGVDRVIRNDPITRVGEDDEGVHQQRVGARRLRSDLRTFGPLLDDPRLDRAKEELRWFGELLGDVRDLDVQIATLRTSAAEVADDLRPMFEEMDRGRSEARAHMLEGMSGRRYREMIDLLVQLASDPVTSELARQPCVEVLPPLVRPAWKKLKGSARRAVGEEVPDEDLHRVRIEAKRTRYAAEAVATALGPRADDAVRFARLCARLQDILGAHQDAVVSQTIIREIAAQQPADRSFHLAAGVLLERQRRTGDEMRAMFPEGWRRLNQRKVRSWFA